MSNVFKTWDRGEYCVLEVAFDYDLHEFEVIKGEKILFTITPDSIAHMDRIKQRLNAGECVSGWDDGMGNTIVI
jgi:hypothetical protein